MSIDRRNVPNESDAILPLFFPYALIKLLTAHGIDPKSVITGTGITPDSLTSLDTRISHTNQMLLLKNAEQAWRKPGLGLEFGRSLRLYSLGMIGQAAYASSTLGEAMDTITRYLALRSPLLSYSLFRRRAGTFYVLSGTRNLGNTERFMIESAFAATARFLSELAGKPIGSIEFNFKRKARGNIEQYRESLGDQVSFEQSSDSIFIPSKFLQLKLSTSNQISAEEARRYCEAEITQIGTELGFKEVVYTLLNSSLTRTPTESEAAKILGYSTRSLRRRLAQQNTTFRELLRRVRYDAATRLLSTTHMRVEDIAYEIGYLNVGNFSRAFKTWTGLSPSIYRRHTEDTEIG